MKSQNILVGILPFSSAGELLFYKQAAGGSIPPTAKVKGTLANGVIKRSVEARQNSVQLGEVPQQQEFKRFDKRRVLIRKFNSSAPDKYAPIAQWK